MLQEQGDRPARPGRPSLIAPGGNAEPARQILSSLDAKPAAKSAPARKTSRTLLWGGLGAATIAVAAGLFTLSGRESDDTTVALASAPAPAAAPRVAAAPVAPAPTPVPTPAPVSDAAVVRDALEATPAAPQPSVTEVLAAPSKPAAKKDQLTQALERPAQKKAAESKAESKPEHKPEHKAERSTEHKAESRSESKAENKKAERKKTAADKPAKAAPNQADSDAALLAALMTHVRGKKSTPAEQLKICKQYNAAGEAQCRERLCASVASKEPACKTAHKKPADSQPAS
ncbi:hypothetical protein IP92_04479 [Pseudoduganella flava]|uniref:Uncharacterized protein n=1 Tax=Pseudoduganella flava TaxID=871742 RepID=A0A562PHP3_9BURK|nr:hypothetical protein IP92_04479 [Pseudoduganella flava]